MFWNLISKKYETSLAFFWLGTIAALLGLSPAVLVYRDDFVRTISSVGDLYLLTGMFQALYYAGLCHAYRVGDISLVYPLARAVPVLIIGLFGYWWGDLANPWAMFWIVLLVAGCTMSPLQSWKVQWTSYLNRASLFTLLAALANVGYSLTDDFALRRLTADEFPNPYLNAVLFLSGQTLGTLVILSLMVAGAKKERLALSKVLAGQKKQAIATGILVAVTYGMILVAIGMAQNITYVVAFRQLSIPLACAVGIFLLGEIPYRPRVVGVGMIFLGLVGMALAA